MKIIVFIFLLIITSNLYSTEYITYKMNIEHVFNAKDYRKASETDLSINASPGGGHAEGPALFYEGDNLIIADQLIGRNILLNKDYSFRSIFKKSIFDHKTFFLNNYCIGYNENNSIVIFDISKEWLFKSQIMVGAFTNLSHLRNFKDLLYYNDVLFIVDENNKLWSIKNPGLDDNENKSNLRNEEETRKLFDKNSELNRLIIDPENRFLLDGELITINFASFHLYYKSLKPVDFRMSELENKNITEKASNNMILIGFDNKNNSYWTIGSKSIGVFRPNGVLFHYFRLEKILYSTTPTVSPDGDVYFMGYDKEYVTLYKINNQW